MPITMAREFPLVSAKINGVSGVLMFDTGSKDALSLNDHAVVLEGGRTVGHGFFGSGQTFEVNAYPKVETVELGGGLVFRDVSNVTGKDLSFMEKAIAPDFLGFLGFEFFRGYLLALDYKALKLTFYRQTQAREESKDYLEQEKVLAILPFETRKLPNHPLVRISIGDVPFLATFDTGQEGMAYMSKSVEDRLISKGIIAPAQSQEGPLYDISAIKLTPALDASLAQIRIASDGFPAAEPLGIPETELLVLGYGFLRNHKTIWDFKGRKIFILESPKDKP